MFLATDAPPRKQEGDMQVIKDGYGGPGLGKIQPPNNDAYVVIAIPTVDKVEVTGTAATVERKPLSGRSIALVMFTVVVLVTSTIVLIVCLVGHEPRPRLPVAGSCYNVTLSGRVNAAEVKTSMCTLCPLGLGDAHDLLKEHPDDGASTCDTFAIATCQLFEAGAAPSIFVLAAINSELRYVDLPSSATDSEASAALALGGALQPGRGSLTFNSKSNAVVRSTSVTSLHAQDLKVTEVDAVHLRLGRDDRVADSTRTGQLFVGDPGRGSSFLHVEYSSTVKVGDKVEDPDAYKNILQQLLDRIRSQAYNWVTPQADPSTADPSTSSNTNAARLSSATARRQGFGDWLEYSFNALQVKVLGTLRNFAMKLRLGLPKSTYVPAYIAPGCDPTKQVWVSNGKAPTSNGCGSGWTVDLVPDFEFLTPKLGACCDQHDMDYGTCGKGKTDADAALKKCIEDSNLPIPNYGSILASPFLAKTSDDAYVKAQVEYCQCRDRRPDELGLFDLAVNGESVVAEPLFPAQPMQQPVSDPVRKQTMWLQIPLWIGTIEVAVDAEYAYNMPPAVVDLFNTQPTITLRPSVNVSMTATASLTIFSSERQDVKIGLPLTIVLFDIVLRPDVASGTPSNEVHGTIKWTAISADGNVLHQGALPDF